MIYVVYRHTCVCNGKSYVGMTGDRDTIAEDLLLEELESKKEDLLEKRWLGHCANAAKNSTCVFHNAIRRHGPEAFEHAILDVCHSRKNACAREKYWIRELDSTIDGAGYNMTYGGECFGVLTEDCKRRHRKATSVGTRKAFRDDPTIRERQSKTLKLRYENESTEAKERRRAAMKVAHNRPETRERKSRSLKEVWKTSEKLLSKRKEVQQLDLKTGDVIVTHCSAHEAARQTGIAQGNISLCARGVTLSAGGFDWRYTSEPKQRRQRKTTWKIVNNPWDNPAFKERESAKRRGTKNVNAKLTEDIVHQIRSEFDALDKTKFGAKSEFYARQAAKYDVTSNLICYVVRRKCWKHVK